jgi:hypothetical protein
MFGKGLGACIMFDYVMTDGKNVHKAMDKLLETKNKIVNFNSLLKDKIKVKLQNLTSEKKEEESVES